MQRVEKKWWKGNSGVSKILKQGKIAVVDFYLPLRSKRSKDHGFVFLTRSPMSLCHPGIRTKQRKNNRKTVCGTTSVAFFLCHAWLFSCGISFEYFSHIVRVHNSPYFIFSLYVSLSTSLPAADNDNKSTAHPFLPNTFYSNPSETLGQGLKGLPD